MEEWEYNHWLAYISLENDEQNAQTNKVR